MESSMKTNNNKMNYLEKNMSLKNTAFFILDKMPFIKAMQANI